MIPRVKTVETSDVKNLLNVFGKLSSILLMSLEKRLRILPSGVVSKNDIGDFNIALVINLCKLEEALMEQY